MDQRQKQLLTQIKKNAIYIDWHVAFGGKSMGNNHLSRVNKIANFLAQKEGGDLFLILASAWIHDVSLASGNDNNPKVILEKTSQFLKQFELSDEEIKQISGCASHHEEGGQSLSLEAKIVHDSDVIDKSGMMGVIRHIWKMTNLIHGHVLSTEGQFSELKSHLLNREARLYTNTAKDIAKKLNIEMREFFNAADSLNMMKEISLEAWKGKTSDMVAEQLSKKNQAIFKDLEAQLNCNYLI